MPDERSREALLLGAVVVAAGILNWHFASRSFFLGDDILLFQESLGGGYTSAFLFSKHDVHVSPGMRLATLLIQRHATFDFDVALGLLLAAHSVGVVLLQRILRLAFGARWWTFALAFAYGISIVVQPSLQWFSAGILIIPAATLALATIHAHLLWWRTGRPAWLWWSVIALTGGLLFDVRVALVPVYVVLIRLLLLEPGARLRDNARAATREWRVWALYAVPVVLTLAIYTNRGAGDRAKGISFDTLVEYLRTAWTSGFVPALFGIRVPVHGDPTFHAVATTLCQVALAIAVAISLARRRSAWRPWAVVVAVFMINALLVIPRVATFGLDIAYVVRYFTDSVYVALIAIAFAFATPSWPPAERPSLGLPGPWVAAAAALGLAVYGGFAFASDAAFTRHSPGIAARAWVDNLNHDLDGVRRAGLTPTLLDQPVSRDLLLLWEAPKGFPPQNYLSAVVSLYRWDVRFDEVSPRTYRVRPDGHLGPVRFAPVAGGETQRLPMTGLSARGSATYVPTRGLCVTGHGLQTSVEIRPRRPMRGREWYLRTTYRTDSGGVPFLGIDRGVGYPLQDDRLLAARPRGGSSLTGLGALPTGVPTLTKIRVDVLRGHQVCFTRFEIGSFAPA